MMTNGFFFFLLIFLFFFVLNKLPEQSSVLSFSRTINAKRHNVLSVYVCTCVMSVCLFKCSVLFFVRLQIRKQTKPAKKHSLLISFEFGWICQIAARSLYAAGLEPT